MVLARRILGLKARGNENPGVGKYHNPNASSMLWNPHENKGTSNFKGYGGLVSKTNRFSTRKELEAAQEPGPGSHNSIGVWESRRDFNAASVTANYARPRRYRDDPPVDTKMVPGPGQYATQNMNRAINTKRSVGRSSFRSNSSRLRKESIDSRSQPAPGDYDVRAATQKLNAFGSLKGQSAWGKDKAPRGMDAILRMGSNGPGPGAYRLIKRGYYSKNRTTTNWWNPCIRFYREEEISKSKQKWKVIWRYRTR